MNAKTVFLFLVVLLFVRPSVYSQAMLTSAANAARDGDSLVMRHLDVASPGSAGHGVVWDMSGADLGKRCILQYAADSCSQTAQGQYTSWRTVMHGDTLFLTGFENRHTLMEFDESLPLLRYPFAYGDSICGSFHGVGKWCDRSFMRVWGDGVTRADALGTLILPSGDTLSHVLRTHTLRRTWQASVDSVRTWDSLCDVVRQEDMRDAFPNVSGMEPVIDNTYAWYAPGWRYPVLQVEYIADMIGSALQAVVYPPDSQMELDYDMENALLRQSIEPKGGFHFIGDDGDSHALIPRSFNIDSSAQVITVSFMLSGSANVSLQLSDSSGITWRRVAQTFDSGGAHSLIIRYTGLPHGQYVMCITCGSDVFTEKFKVS